MSYAVYLFLCFRPSARATALKDTFRSDCVNVRCNLLMIVFSPLRQGGGLERHFSVCLFVNVLCNVLMFLFSPLRQGGGRERHFFGMFLKMSYAICSFLVFSPLRHDGGFEGHFSVCFFCECPLQSAQYCVFAPSDRGGKPWQAVSDTFSKMSYGIY